MTEGRRTLSEEDVRQIARDGAHQGVMEAFRTLGIDSDQPIEAQKDFAFLRGWRQSTDAVKRTSFLTATAVIITSFLGLVWYALKGS